MKIYCKECSWIGLFEDLVQDDSRVYEWGEQVPLVCPNCGSRDVEEDIK